MARYVLVYRGDSIELPLGETLVGRAITCRLRFNDPAVSRVHARFTVTEDSVTVEDLHSTNGIRVNGLDVSGVKKLGDGDQIQIGHRWLQMEMLTASADHPHDEPPTIDRKDEWRHPNVRQHDAEEETLDRGVSWALKPGAPKLQREEETEDGVSAWRAPLGQGKKPVAPARGRDDGFPDVAVRNCPHCRAICSSASDTCPDCGYQWPAGRPSSVTQRIKLEAIDRRVGKRKVVEIPVLYASETLTLDTVARDLSRGGMFVASELLDPIDTACMITVLPDGGPAISLTGVVCHVVQTEMGEGGRPPGLGVKFTTLTPEAERWLLSILGNAPRSTGPLRATSGARGR